MYRTLYTLALVGGTTLINGCPSKKVFLIHAESSPAGARIIADGEYKCDAPCSFTWVPAARWIGVLNSPDGWSYTGPLVIKALPRVAGQETQVESIDANTKQNTDLKVFFEMGLQQVTPRQRIDEHIDQHVSTDKQ